MKYIVIREPGIASTLSHLYERQTADEDANYVQIATGKHASIQGIAKKLNSLEEKPSASAAPERYGVTLRSSHRGPLFSCDTYDPAEAAERLGYYVATEITAPLLEEDDESNA